MNGRCLCGEITFTVEHAEVAHHACHCGMCRRWAGGSAFFGAKVTGLTFTSTAQPARFRSSKWAERGFCRTCGTTLFYLLLPTGEHTMSVGTFDDPAPFTLALEIFIDRKPGGYAYVGEHPRWSEEETFARLTPPG